MIDAELKKANILIVDDQPANVAILEGFLQMQGYENLATTTDPRNVMQLYATFEPDLILLDLMMPYLSGYEVMNLLKPLVPEGTFLPILVLTADATNEAKQKALSGGASDFLTKPFDLIEVGLRIKNLLYTNYLQQQMLNQNQILDQKVKERTEELEKTNHELVIALERAEASDKLKTSFIQNVSHEIRTPLNGIIGFGGLLADPDYSAEDRKDFMSMLQASSERLINTVTDYMDISLIVSNLIKPNIHNFDGMLLMDELYDKYQVKCIEKEVKLTIQYPSEIDTLPINNDKELFLKVFYHLLDNSLKFIRKGEIKMGFSLTPGFVEFFVIDSGIGIDPAAHSLVFEVFTQENSSTNRGHEGSGLGLSICKGFVKVMGGTIRLQSEKGVGTEVYFSLPIDYDAQHIKHISDDADKKTEASKPIVLIAEDDPSNRVFFELILKKYCSKLFLAENGKEAVEICKSHPEISLVLMDLKMPIMNGQTATKLIRSFNSEVPIIAITAYTMDNESISIEGDGFNGYLSKPCGKSDFLRKLKNYGIMDETS